MKNPYTIQEADRYLHQEKNLPLRLSEDYFWVRKCWEVVSLFQRNQHLFPDGGQFVELGCGSAPELWAIREALEAKELNYIGTEIDEAELAQCYKKLEEQNIKNVRFEPCNLTGRFQWEDASVDIIYSSEVFEHIKEIDAMMDEIHRVLKPGGYLAFTTPNEPNVFQPTFYGIKRKRPNAPDLSQPLYHTEEGIPIYGHVTLLTNRNWDKLLARHGFDLVDNGRGAIWYGAYNFQNTKWCFALQRCVEWFLDCLPRKIARPFSDGVIALYQKRK